ncbi:amidohydrolase family protein [Nitratireductor sp. GZWM139]|uniref:amidohydrolase family protein n=1 Tax=Nitratireductor sp. GZWM139 TaxID=2950541 RepID=UPI0024BDB2C6|nr:amidohydrolase family protein [Nitratireductor sp. GZWM139]MDJ1466096.1 amidohydrolase family protein [Nitratireductor sp. GZWM139]
MTRKLIKAGHIIAHQDDGHKYLRNGVIMVEDDKIAFVGKEFDGEVDETIDSPDTIVTPGFINTHAHLTESPLDRSFVEDRGPRQFYLSGLFEYLTARDGAITDDARRACAAFSIPELIRSGTTTIMEIGGHGDFVVEQAGKCGLRAYVGEGYKSGRWLTNNGRTVDYEWFDDDGEAAFQRAVDFINRVEGKQNDRIRGFLTPLQVDTVSKKMLQKSCAVASEMNVPLALHTSQSVVEFQEMTRRHGCTPIEWLERIGFLGPNVILGHAILPGGSSWTNYPSNDIQILADTATNVAHAVWVFARRGIAMESYSRYLAAGVNMTLATDTCPQSMLEALRWTAVVSKIIDRQTEVATAADVFNSATLAGAKALNRDDLGRISVGAKADMLFWKGSSLSMTPLRDPIRNIVYSAQSEDLHSTMIDGEWVMRDREVKGFSVPELTAQVQRGAEYMWENMHHQDWGQRDINTLSPESFPRFRAN